MNTLRAPSARARVAPALRIYLICASAMVGNIRFGYRASRRRVERFVASADRPASHFLSEV